MGIWRKCEEKIIPCASGVKALGGTTGSRKQDLKYTNHNCAKSALSVSYLCTNHRGSPAIFLLQTPMITVIKRFTLEVFLFI